MPALNFPPSSTPGAIVGEGDGRLINAWAEKNGKKLYLRRSAGLSVVTDTGQSGPRGMFDLDGALYIAFTGVLIKIAPDLSAAVIGTLPGSDGVTFARNNRTTTDGSGNTTSTPDLVAVRSTGGAYLVDPVAGTIAAYPDANLPAGANSVSFLGGYLIFTLPDGRFFATGLNTTAINALSFATAESSPDGLVRGIESGGKFYAVGSASIEPWLNVGNTPFPLARATSVIPIGALTTMAISGFEDGWSLSPIFVSQDCTVQELNGYGTTKLSTPDVERFVQRSTVSTLEASVYTFNGNPVWALSSDQGTWEFNPTTRQWNERLSTGAMRWRGSRSVYSNGRWLVGDALSGKILKVDPTVRSEAGALLAFTAESAPLKAYPNRFAIPDLFCDFTLGIGTVSAPNPHAAISWSKDGGATWSTPSMRALGGAGHPVGPVRVNRLGLATHHGIRVRVAVSDDADFSFMGASIGKPETRAP